MATFARKQTAEPTTSHYQAETFRKYLPTVCSMIRGGQCTSPGFSTRPAASPRWRRQSDERSITREWHSCRRPLRHSPTPRADLSPRTLHSH